LEPFQQQEVTLALDGKSGAIRLRMLFKPDYVVRSRQGSSTFSGTFAVPGKVIGAPVKGVGKGAAFVGGGVVRAGTFLGRGFKRRKSRGANGDEDFERPGSEERPSVDVPLVSVEGGNSTTISAEPTTPNRNTAEHNRHRSWGAQSFASRLGDSATSGAGEQGIANIQILSADGFPPGTNLRVFVQLGKKDVHKTDHIKTATGSVEFDNESFKVPCTADQFFKVTVKDHSTFGRDDELGEAQFTIDDSGAGGEKNIGVGKGMVVIRSSFTPADAGSQAGSVSPRVHKERRGLLSRGKERSPAPPGA
jgi:hypothetical protein